MANIHTAPLEDQVRYVLFKLADAGDAGVPVSGGYLPRDGAREVMRQRLGEAERGILYILPKGHKWMRRNAGVARELVARRLLRLARDVVAKGRYYIEFINRNRKRERKYYDSFREAKDEAARIFKATGIIVGIQED